MTDLTDLSEELAVEYDVHVDEMRGFLAAGEDFGWDEAEARAAAAESYGGDDE